MKQTIEKTWSLLEKTVEVANRKNLNIILNAQAKEKFADEFETLHKHIKENYMREEIQNLDRHKVAAIIMVCILSSDALAYEGVLQENERFFGEYLIAGSVGINYMQDRLNSLLVEKNQNTIDKFWFPEALSCDTKYFEIFCRNLYYADNEEKWGLNPLDIAEKLFLIEYATLEKNGIDPCVLKDI